MHNAPPVSYPVERSVVHGALLLVLWCAAALLTFFWCWQADRLSWRQGLGGASVVAIGALAWWSWRSAPSGQLAWTGQTWLWGVALSAQAEGQVKRALDWQSGLLLQFQSPAQPARWLWLSQASQPRRWADLRRAVYSRARHLALPSSPPLG